MSWTLKNTKKVQGTNYYQLPDIVCNRFETRLESALNRSLNANVARFAFNEFKTNLQRLGAIIAGGSVLRACYDEIPWDIDTTVKSDIDIYVNVRHVPDMKTALNSVATKFSSRKSNLYCNSFLVRNRIREVIEAVGKDIDIVSVRNARRVVDVVTNFDLTMCQVWYDGVHMYATHPSHILDMHGELQGDYIELYKVGNKFLRNRIEKYTNRGFTIDRGTRTSCKTFIQKAASWFLPTAPVLLREHPVSYPVLQDVVELAEYNGMDMSGYDSEDYDELPAIYSIYDTIPNDGRNSFAQVIAHALELLYHKSQTYARNRANYEKKFIRLCNEVKAKPTPAYNKDTVIAALKKMSVDAQAAYSYFSIAVFAVDNRERRLEELQNDINEKKAIITALGGV